MSHNGGNSGRARARVLSTFTPWWAPWRWCWARTPHRARCQLGRRHLGRHAAFDGFDVRYFDTKGTP